MLRLIYVPPDIWISSFMALTKDAERCYQRHLKSAPGDRQEMQKYHTICSQIEILALDLIETNSGNNLLLDNEDSITYLAKFASGLHLWHSILDNYPGLESQMSVFNGYLGRGGTIIHINDPFIGKNEHIDKHPSDNPIAPSQIWRSSKGNKGIAAVAERWDQQLAWAIDLNGALVPSGVSNRVLTEGLRKYVDIKNVKRSGTARVVYRDGSEAKPFPIGQLSLTKNRAEKAPVFRVTLLSMRHPEMDAIVDAAWLRNRDISQVRPMSETDNLVYEISKRQLEQIASRGSRIVKLYQTGLEPAIIGFYRALAEHIAIHLNPISVEPYYYSKSRGFEEGTVWVKSQGK